MHRVISALAIVAVLTFAAATASAVNQPKKGNSWKTNIMVAYAECTAPDTVTDSGEDACSVLTRMDPACGYGQLRGLGKLQVKALNAGNSRYRITINKLEPNCEGDQLNFSIVTRRSGGHCQTVLGSPGDCTVVDITQQFASCIVIKSKCRASGHFQLDGGVEPGQVEVLRFEIDNQSNGVTNAFRTGIINGKP